MAITHGETAESVLHLSARLGPALLPEFAASSPDAAHARRLYRSVARKLWGLTPRAALQWGMQALPAPGRNEPCHCGSLLKYKHCCQPLDEGLPLENTNLLPQVLYALPRKRWRELAGSRVAIDQVAHTASEWREDEDPVLSIALLAPFFAGDADIPDRYEPLLDLLLDAYDQAHKPVLKQRLLDAALKRGNREVRAAALQRRASMAADRGDYAQAWQHFRAAQQLSPDNLSHAHLEITLLISEGQPKLAKERARFWLARLQRQDAPASLLEFLRSVVADGEDALFGVIARHHPWVGRLQEQLARAPPVACHYQLGVDGDHAGPLTESRALRATTTQWKAELDEGFGLIVDGGAVLQSLDSHPVLWQSFEVLTDLAHAVRDEQLIGAHAALLRPLFNRCEALLRLVISTHRAEGKVLDWGWHENRTPQHLLAASLVADPQQQIDADWLRRAEWLVQELNPNDNLAVRALLINAYLERGAFELALALADRYPDDLLPDTNFGGVLALLRLGHEAEAEARLAQQVLRFPHVPYYLLNATAKAPKRHKMGVTVGGADQAHQYAEESRVLWQSQGALDWLRQHSPSKPPTRRARAPAQARP